MTKGQPRGPKLNAEQRRRRNENILRLFLSGATEREISRSPSVQLHPSQVHRIVVQMLEEAGQRYSLISEKALIVYSERLEMLIRAIWTKATGTERDTKAIEVARRLLEQQAKLYNISDERMGMPLPPMGDNELSDDVLDLQRYRERHRKPPEAL